MTIQDLPPPDGKWIGDAASVATAVGAIAGWLPAMAALFTIVWTGIRIYETRTVQRLLGRRRGESHGPK